MAINRETINQVFDVKNPTQILKEKLSNLVSLPGVDDLKDMLSKELVENTIRKNLIAQSQELINSAKNKIIEKVPEVQNIIKDIENNEIYIKNTQNFLDYCTQKSQDLQRIFNKHIVGENDDYTYDKTSDKGGNKTFKKSSTYCLEELDDKKEITVDNSGQEVKVEITFNETIDSNETNGYNTITTNDNDYNEKAHYEIINAGGSSTTTYYWFFHDPDNNSTSESGCSQKVTSNYNFNQNCLNMQKTFSIATLKSNAEKLTDSFEELYKNIEKINYTDDTEEFNSILQNLKNKRTEIIQDGATFKNLFDAAKSIRKYYKTTNNDKTSVSFVNENENKNENKIIPETSEVTNKCPGNNYEADNFHDNKCENMFTEFANTFPTEKEAESIIVFDGELPNVSIKSFDFSKIEKDKDNYGAYGLLTAYAKNFKVVFDIFKLLSNAIDECDEAGKVLDKIDDLTGMIGEVEDTYSDIDGAAEPVYYETKKLEKVDENFKDTFYNYNLSLSETFPPENADILIENANNEAIKKDITFLIGNGFNSTDILIKNEEKVKVLTLYSRINYLNNRENTLQDEYGKKAKEASEKSDEMIKIAQDMQAKLDSFDMSVVTKAIKEEIGGITGDLGSLTTSITTFSGQVASLVGAIINPFSVTAAPAIMLSCLMNGQEVLNKIIGVLGKCDTIGLDISKVDLLNPVYVVMNTVTAIMDKIKTMLVPVEKTSKTVMRVIEKVKKLVGM